MPSCAFALLSSPRARRTACEYIARLKAREGGREACRGVGGDSVKGVGSRKLLSPFASTKKNIARLMLSSVVWLAR